MRIIAVSFTLCLVCLGSFAVAQGENHHQVVCSIGGCKEVNIETPRYDSASSFSVQQVWEVVGEVTSVSGLLPNFQVVATGEVDNAAAVIIEGERYLAFNPDWVSQYKSNPNAKWQLLGVIAHEVGHHLQGHTITGSGSRPPIELEADEYAGFVLAALGATLAEAQSLWSNLPPNGSLTHPPRHQRLAAIERGWTRHNGHSQETEEEREAKATFNQMREEAEVDGNWYAQSFVADAYLLGRGVAKNPEEAAKWYRKAAEGNSTAQYNLGILYLKGNGVQRNAGKAIGLFQRAAAAGQPDAKRVLKELGY